MESIARGAAMFNPFGSRTCRRHLRPLAPPCPSPLPRRRCRAASRATFRAADRHLDVVGIDEDVGRAAQIRRTERGDEPALRSAIGRPADTGRWPCPSPSVAARAPVRGVQHDGSAGGRQTAGRAPCTSSPTPVGSVSLTISARGATPPPASLPSRVEMMPGAQTGNACSSRRCSAVDAAPRRLAIANAEIDLFAPEIADARGVDELQIDIRMERLQLVQPRNEPESGQGRRQGQRTRARSLGFLSLSVALRMPAKAGSIRRSMRVPMGVSATLLPFRWKSCAPR